MLPDGRSLKKRLHKLADYLEENQIDFAIIRQNADIFYFTGTVQDGHLIITKEGQVHFLVWRDYSRARYESPLESLLPLKGLRSLKETLSELGISNPKRLGLELDVLPANIFLYYTKKLWPNVEALDISHPIRLIRRTKEPIEIENIKVACSQAMSALEDVQKWLKQGMSELEITAKVEALMRQKGHAGLLRMRIWNQEMGMGQIVSGLNGLLPSWTNTPVGGRGPSAAFGMGASFRKVRSGDIISIDIGGWWDGYCSDITRPFSIGKAEKHALVVFERVKAIMEAMEERLIPGTKAKEIYNVAQDLAKEAGMQDYFMGIGDSRVSFVGHGLGIELDEYPFFTKGNEMVIEPGMVVALEPKFLIPGIGVIGLEDTFEITEKGPNRLTTFPRTLTEVEC